MSTITDAQGRWREILPLFGVDPKFLVNRHGPCALCGGRDRFRFDDKDGSGSYFCNQCGAGNGVTMVRKMRGGISFKDACDEIDAVLGSRPKARTARHPAASADEQRRDRARRLERLLRAPDDRDLVVSYLRSRGLQTFPKALRGHAALGLWDDEAGHVGSFPAVIAPILGLGGELQSAQRIYMLSQGRRKKKNMRKIDSLKGAAVRLFEADEVLGVAERVETAIAAKEIFGVPTWAALSATGIENFKPPPGVKRIVIFPDNDRNFVGQTAAFLLGRSLVRAGEIEDVKIKLPPAPGTDWLDVLNQRGRTYQFEWQSQRIPNVTSRPIAIRRVRRPIWLRKGAVAGYGEPLQRTKLPRNYIQQTRSSGLAALRVEQSAAGLRRAGSR